jgi:iron complex outermembrane receptor protein
MGFRVDGESAGQRDQWMVQGDLFKIGRQDALGYPVVTPTVVDREQGHSGYGGGYLQARWARTGSDGRESALQFSYDRTDVDYPYVGGLLQNLTLDYQKRRSWGERNEIYWGAGFQQYWDNTYYNRYQGFSPLQSVYRVGDVVVRDEYQLVPGRWLASLGARVDYNSYRRVEYQPSFRLLFTPNARQSAWIGAARAVRAPDRVDRDLRLNGGEIAMGKALVDTTFSGNPGMRSEIERSLEGGYRLQSGQRWSVDASIFWSYYDRLRAGEAPIQPQVEAPRTLVLPFETCNCGWGRTYGAEIWATWQVSPGWRIMPSYSYLNETKWLPDQTFTRYAWEATANIPHQGLLRSQHNLSRNWKFDWMARARSRDKGWDLPGVPLLDAHLSWRPSRGTELSLGVQNVTDRRVLESYSDAPVPSLPLRRTFVIRWTQKF